MKNWLDNWGRISLGKIKDETLVWQAQDCLSFYGTMIKKMLVRKNSCTWKNTFEPLQNAISGIENFYNSIDFLTSIGKLDSNSYAVETAKDKISSFLSQTYFNRKIALRLHELKRTKLSEEKLSILTTALASYRESFYPDRDRRKIQNIDRQLSFFEDDFVQNMRKAKKSNYILLNEDNSLEFIPDEIKLQALKNAKTINCSSTYAFDLGDDVYLSLMSFCSCRATRKYIYQYRVSLASSQNNNNENTLKKLIHWRNKKAKINGHHSYSDYATSYSGLECSEVVFGFLDNMRTHLSDSYSEYELLFKKFAKDYLGIEKIYPWDRAYIKSSMDDVLKDKLEIKDIEIDYQKAKLKMFDLAHEMFGLKIELAPPDILLWDRVEAYRVTDKDNQILSDIIFDVFKREEKPTGLIYQYTLNHNQLIKNQYRPSLQAIVMHLEPQRAFISIEDTITLFHEFGHALHVLLTQKTYHQNHPFSIEYDAIEFPSQWFEKFAENVDFIKQVGVQNKRPISRKKADRLIQYSKIHKPHQYWIHILHSRVDMHLNTHFKPQGAKTFHQALAPIFSEYNQKLTKYNQFQNNQFEHFYMGSVYYGYLWAEHMINLCNKKLKSLEYAQQGDIIQGLLNNSLNRNFSLEFSDLIENPKEALLEFEINNDLFRQLLNFISA